MTRTAPTHPRERRAEVERLLRDTRLTMAAIAARVGVSPRVVSAWNARSGHRAPRRGPRSDLAAWPAPRRAALARLRRAAGVDPADLADVAGVAKGAVDALVRGLDERSGTGPARAGRGTGGLDAAALRTSLRAHVARQIAAFDAALRGEGAAVFDSARVLRDLGGLKRLFDDLVAEDPAREGGDDEPDLPALRAEIARRYARFVGEREPP